MAPAYQMSNQTWWESLNHGGLLIGPKQLAAYFPQSAPRLNAWTVEQLRRHLNRFDAAFKVDEKRAAVTELLNVVLEKVARLDEEHGTWKKDLGSEWSRTLVTGESHKPRRIWTHPNGTAFPVFISEDERLGIGRGVRSVSKVLEWLRKGSERIALLTNGRQWRLIHAGLDHDAWAQWDTEQWVAESEPAPQTAALQILLNPEALLPKKTGELSPLLAAINETRKGQAEVSAELGERVRKAVELLIQAHAAPLDEKGGVLARKDVYLAAVRMVMRMVVVLFAEARDLLPRDNALYFGSYGLQGLRESLRRAAGGRLERLRTRHGAWPRVLALFRLVYEGSPHRALPVPRYGGELFRPGIADGDDGIRNAVHLFETACFEHEVSDAVIYQMLELITTTHVRVRQGTAAKLVPVPVNFADLSTEYIGMLYEGLLGYELRRVEEEDEAIVILKLGDEPALPLRRLEAMSDKTLSDLVDKFKQKAAAVDVSGDDEESEEEEPEAEGAEEESGEETSESEDADEEPVEVDSRQVIRDRAVDWAKRAVVAGKLVTKPKGKKGNADAEYAQKISEKAKQITGTAYLPGQYFLIRSSGTRKGSGTFYTRPALAIPTTQRTLRPLAWIAPNGEDGAPNELAPVAEWTPRKPEEILALKVCDPACGSASFLVAALRFLTDSLYASLHHHGRIREHGDGALITLAEGKESAGVLSEETLPSRPDDPSFEARLKARLKRYVVERCIYGVDYDRLAIELARMALWIETMDRELPFEFLDHRVKSGNSLVGCWLDVAARYPVMAWKYREGGDKSHTNGVHYPANAHAETLKRFREAVLVPSMRSYLAGGTLFSRDVLAETLRVQDYTTGVMASLTELPVADGEARALAYRDKIVLNRAVTTQRELLDRWCATWFWPLDDLSDAPLPSTFQQAGAPSGSLQRTAAAIMPFHWELEFSDVFTPTRRGFDAVLGNPPWENAQANPEEFFSSLDPLFRTYSRAEKRDAMRRLFADERVERAWRGELERRKAFANWVRWAGNPLGKTASGWEVSVGKETPDWYARLVSLTSPPLHSDPVHPFMYQVGRVFTYKLFLELGLRLLRDGGVLSFVVPSGLYGDAWSQRLRELFTDDNHWTWCFAFENRERVFEIDERFKFCVAIVVKRPSSGAIAVSFGHTELSDWQADPPQHARYSRDLVARLSPTTRLLFEIESNEDLPILESIHRGKETFATAGESWKTQYGLEFMMNSDAKLFRTRPRLEEEGYRRDEYGRWLIGSWKAQRDEAVAREIGVIHDSSGRYFIHESEVASVALPLFEGRMVGQFDFSEKRWVSGRGRSAVWEPVPWEEKSVGPQYLMLLDDFRERLVRKRDARRQREQRSSARETFDEAGWWARQSLKVGFMDVSSATNARTMVSTLLPAVPCGNKVPVLNADPETAAILPAVLNSFVFDFVMRRRLIGLSINSFVLDEAPLPDLTRPVRSVLSDLVLRLAAPHPAFAPAWLEVKGVDSRDGWQSRWILDRGRRQKARAVIDAVIAAGYGLTTREFDAILEETDLPIGVDGHKRKGFWRVDQGDPVEQRLTHVARNYFHALSKNLKSETLDTCAGSLVQSAGLGPATSEGDSAAEWAACHLHARNILGQGAYDALLRGEQYVTLPQRPTSPQASLFGGPRGD
jgi:hypothetical protein